MDFYHLHELELLRDHKITYEYFRISTVTRFVSKYYALFDNTTWAIKANQMSGHALAGAMLDLYDWYALRKLPDIEIIQNLADVMFPKFLSTMECDQWVLDRIEEYTTIIQKLTDCIRTNYETFNITEKKANGIIWDMRHRNYASIRKVFKDTLPKFYSNKLAMYNGWGVGLGSVLFSISVKNDTSHARNLRGWQDGMFDFTFSDILFYYLTKYDITIISHGDDMVVTKNDWIIQPVKSPFDHITYHSASKLILALKEQPNIKRINLLSCNPNKVKLYPEIYKDPHYLVNIYEGNVFIG